MEIISCTDGIQICKFMYNVDKKPSLYMVFGKWDKVYRAMLYSEDYRSHINDSLLFDILI